MSNFRDGMIGPSVILVTICLVITFALAGTYQATDPIIQANELAAAETARAEVLPAAVPEEDDGEDTFTQITNVALPDEIMEAYVANNGAGYVFKVGSKGFDGIVTFMVGMDTDGKYTGIQMFDHNETPGLGTKVGVDTYLEQYSGQSNPDTVDSITGATRTSTALKNSLRACNAAYDLLS